MAETPEGVLAGGDLRARLTSALFPDRLKLQDGVKITGAAHGALGLDESVEREDTNFDAIQDDGIALLEAFLIAAEAFDFAEAVKLPQVNGEVEILEAATLSLFTRESQMSRGHAMDGVQVLDGLEESDEIVGVHATGDIDVAGHLRPTVNERTEPTCDDEIDAVLSEKTRDAGELMHWWPGRRRGGIRLR